MVNFVLLTEHLGIIFVNKQLDAQFFFMYVYFCSLHVSDSYVTIIRRINCINTISSTYMSLCVDDRLVCRFGFIHACINLHTVTYTRCRCHIDTINSPDDGHIAVRNMETIEINIYLSGFFKQLSPSSGNQTPFPSVSPLICF